MNINRIKFLLLVFVFCSTHVRSKIDSCRFKPLNAIMQTLDVFIDSVKPNSISNGKYNVYVIQIYLLNEKKKELGFTLGYIHNEYDLNYLDKKLTREYENEIVIITYNKKINIKLTDCLGFRKIQDKDLEKIEEKLYPKKNGGITGTSSGLVYYSKKNNGMKVYYENSDEIPIEKSIFSKTPNVKVREVK